MNKPSRFGAVRVDRLAEPREEALYVACIAQARRSSDPVRLTEYLMAYLQTFPTGHHNRTIAEEIERALDDLAGERSGEILLARYRALRDEYLPPITRASLPSERHEGRAAVGS